MRTGILDGILNAGIWQRIYDSGELGSAVTSITISNLDGNTDKEYRLICRFVSNSTPNESYYSLRFNNDLGANYGRQRIDAGGSVYEAASATGQDRIWLMAYGTIQNNLAMTDTIMYVKNGYVRTAITKAINDVTGTTIERLSFTGHAWNNTTNNITSLVIVADQTNGIGIGSRILLLRKMGDITGMKTGDLNVQGKVVGCLQKIYKTTLTTAVTSVTISELDGNTDVLYELFVRGIGGSASATAVRVRPNNDSAANYGIQYLSGINTTIGAGRDTAQTGFALHYNGWAQNQLAQSSTLIYAKSGYVRTRMSILTEDVSGTTITRIALYGNSWNNTIDNITSLTVVADQTNGLGVGTFIELWAYRL